MPNGDRARGEGARPITMTTATCQPITVQLPAEVREREAEPLPRFLSELADLHTALERKGRQLMGLPLDEPQVARAHAQLEALKSHIFELRAEIASVHRDLLRARLA